jgi:hypothetical protein
MSRNVGFRHLLKDPKMMGLAKRAGALAEMISAADGHVASSGGILDCTAARLRMMIKGVNIHAPDDLFHDSFPISHRTPHALAEHFL